MLKLFRFLGVLGMCTLLACPAFAKPTQLTLQVMQPSNQPIAPVFEEWAKTMMERSEGKLDIKIVWSGGITGVPGSYAGLRDGSLDIAGYSTGWNMNENPYAISSALPYITNSADKSTRFIWKLLETPEYAKEANKDMKLLAAYGSGMACFVSNKVLIQSPADLKGRRVLFLGGATYAKEIEVWGGTPVITASTDIYAALQRGLGEVFYGSFPNVKNLKLYEVAKYYTLFSNSPPEQRVGINHDLFNDLPKDLQDIIVETSGFPLSVKFSDALMGVEKSDVEFLVKEGCTVKELTPEELKVFSDLSMPVLMDMARKDLISRGVTEPDVWITKAYEIAKSIQ